MTDTIVSPVWGNIPEPITQPFANYGYRPDWYQYSETLGFGPGYHVGTDIAVPLGTDIHAAVGGTVIQDEFSNSFRPYPVWILSDDNPSTPENEAGYIAIYGHLMAEFVKTGQHVTAGQLIGKSGEQTVYGTTTPDGSGPHLHMEVRKPDSTTPSGYRAIDPKPYLTGTAGDVIDTVTGGGVEAIVADTGAKLAIVLRRAVLLLVGGVILYAGLNALLTNHTRVRMPTAKGTATKVAKVVVTKRG